MYKTKLNAELQKLFENGQLFNASELISKLQGKYDKSTVYRQLEKLAAINYLTKVTENNGTIFYEKNREHAHPHFICEVCNSIKCFLNAQTIELSVRLLASQNAVSINKIRLFGVCGNCQFSNKS